MFLIPPAPRLPRSIVSYSAVIALFASVLLTIAPATSRGERILFYVPSDPTIMQSASDFGTSLVYADLLDGHGPALYVGAPSAIALEGGLAGCEYAIYGIGPGETISGPTPLLAETSVGGRLGAAAAYVPHYRLFSGQYYPLLAVGAWGENKVHSYSRDEQGVPGLLMDSPGGVVNYGSCVSTVDFNGDGYGDVVVGSSAFGEGAVCIYLGGPGADYAYDIMFVRGAAVYGFGAVVAGVGNVTPDSYGDVIIGAETGGTYLIFGRPLDQAVGAAPVLSIEDGPEVYIGMEITQAGCRGATGGVDFTADGHADIVVTGRIDSRNFVWTYAGPFTQGSMPEPVSTIRDGATFGDRMIVNGDADGDGINDLVIGSRGSDSAVPGRGNNVGTVAVLFGGHLPAYLDLVEDGYVTSRYQWFVSPEDLVQDSRFGTDLVFIGDQDGDGCDDVAVGAPGRWILPSVNSAVYGIGLAGSDKIEFGPSTESISVFGVGLDTEFTVAATHSQSHQLVVTMHSESLGIGSLALADNGDGTYTGTVSGLNVGPGMYEVEYFALSPWGTPYSGDGSFALTRATVQAVLVSATYVDRSQRPDGAKLMPYQGLPYSSVTVDFDGTGPRDMVVSLLNDRAQLYAATQMTVDGGIPEYSEDTDAFATGSKPDDVLGVAVADINSDGHEELFGASQAAPRLYQLQGAAYVDMASTWGISTSALLSTTGAWADFDCDGDVDLAIGTSDCGAFEPGVYNAGPPVHDVLLRNDLNTAGTFTDVSVVSGLQPDYYSNSTTVTWGDVNDDGFPDLFVGEFGEPATGPLHGIDCRLFVNRKDGTFVDVGDSLIGIHAAVFTIGAVWRDMDNDGALDLELANKTSRESLRFDPATGLFAIDISEDDGNYSGLQVYDHDLDGVEDVLLLPSGAADVPRLLAGSLDGLSPTYTNVTAATGIAIPGKIGGAVAADLNGDGDIDLFMGREPEKDAGGAYLEGDQYLFQAKSQAGTVDAPANNWLSIRLQSPNGMNNRMGIGAKVRVYDSGRQRVRMVDGGSGRGGQDDPTMVFGLGAGTTVDSVTVDWPNGYHQVVTGANLNISTGPGGNGSNLIVDPSTLTIAKGFAGTYEFVPGGGVVDWVFSWETPNRTNPAMDRVIFDNQNMAPECLQPVDEISPGDAGVIHTVELLANGRWRHEMRWLNRPCLAGCVIKFSVKSGVNANEVQSAVTTFSTRFCPSN